MSLYIISRLYIMKKNKKTDYLCLLVLLTLLMIIIFYFMLLNKKENFTEYNFEETKNNLLEVENIYDKNKSKILWPDIKIKFMQENWPNTFNWDFAIKEDIIKEALTLEQNKCIIDAGAHIGDGAIPIAHFLIKNGRSDIIVYAIEPSLYKCNFINFIKEKNNLTNLIVINYGLSDKNKMYNTKTNRGNNSGAWNWKELFTNKEVSEAFFDSLDNLVKNKIINNNIGIIHLDVELMETNVLNGAKYTINENKPYLSIENNNGSKYLDLLPTGYKLLYNLNSNQIFKFIE